GAVREFYRRAGSDDPRARALEGLRQVYIDADRARKLDLVPTHELPAGRGQRLKKWVGRRNRGQAFIPELQRNKGRVVRQVRQHIQRHEGDERRAEQVGSRNARRRLVKPDITGETPCDLSVMAREAIKEELPLTRQRIERGGADARASGKGGVRLDLQRRIGREPGA